ncbi:hypothetical protein WJX74_006772 [Apatococcus lobatus]|uniref:Uncharacterized protein n=1 Tax=Apatococcus lobatus TaxID=904363 RepID=A0AAW1R0L1_9CHLO
MSSQPSPAPSEPAPHLTTAQLRERLARDPFTARAHFEGEYDAILRDSLPQKVTEQDLKDPRAPTVAGKLLPKGAVTQLFPISIGDGTIKAYPSPGQCADGDAVLAAVNRQLHQSLLRLQPEPGKRHPPDYVAWASMEVEDQVIDAEGCLVGGSYMLTVPETYYPTAWCRKAMRVKGVAYPPSNRQKRPVQQVRPLP